MPCIMETKEIFREAAKVAKENMGDEQLQALIRGLSNALSSMVLSGDYETGEDRNYLMSVASIVKSITEYND